MSNTPTNEIYVYDTKCLLVIKDKQPYPKRATVNKVHWPPQLHVQSELNIIMRLWWTSFMRRVGVQREVSTQDILSNQSPDNLFMWWSVMTTICNIIINAHLCWEILITGEYVVAQNMVFNYGQNNLIWFYFQFLSLLLLIIISIVMIHHQGEEDQTRLKSF